MFRCLKSYEANFSILESENWFRIEDIGVLNHFVNDLKNGTRERELKKFMAQNLDLIIRAIRHGSQEKSKSFVNHFFIETRTFQRVS